MFLSRNFNYPSRLLSIATKIVVNQCLFTPLFNSYFFGMQAFLAGDNLVEVWDRIKRTVPTSMLNSVKVWPLITAINFTWVPIEVSLFLSWGLASVLRLRRHADCKTVPERLRGNHRRRLADLPVVVEQAGRGRGGQGEALRENTTIVHQDGCCRDCVNGLWEEEDHHMC